MPSSPDSGPTAKSGAEAFAGEYLANLSRKLAAVDVGAVSRLLAVLGEAHDRSSTIYLFGNGGSAATASHWANDLMAVPGARFQAISLADNTAILTALANDHGYQEVFIRQIESLLMRGDVAIGISASGNSVNVLRAIERAAAMGAVTVGVTGFDGGELRRLVQVSLHVPSPSGEYGLVEDVHLAMNHLIAAYFGHAFAKPDSGESFEGLV